MVAPSEKPAPAVPPRVPVAPPSVKPTAGLTPAPAVVAAAGTAPRVKPATVVLVRPCVSGEGAAVATAEVFRRPAKADTPEVLAGAPVSERPGRKGRENMEIFLSSEHCVV